MNHPPAAWSDEQVHAFVDGELDAASAAQLQASLPQDAALAARVAQQRALRARLAAAFDPVRNEPVPPRLLQAIEGRGGVATPIGAAPRQRGGRAMSAPPLWWAAAAASVLAAILVGWSLPRSGEDPLLVAADAGLLAGGALERALAQQLSAAEPDASGVQVSLSFRSAAGRYCRVFGLASGIDGLACRTPAGWQVEATGRAMRDPGAQYRQAASTLSPAVLSAVSGQQAGDALTTAEEQQARERGWR